jgi:hypothetical protein
MRRRLSRKRLPVKGLASLPQGPKAGFVLHQYPLGLPLPVQGYRRVLSWIVSQLTMATPTLDPKTSDTVQALVQLLRSRSAEEIRQRMYDNPPGSPWWAACKTELDLRNSERAATALVDTSRVLDKLRSATDHLDELADKLLQATTDMAEVVKSVRESGRRMEVATYVIVGLTIVQLFYIAFQFSARH